MSLRLASKKWGQCHHKFTGWCGGTPYFKVAEKGVIDGINREHLPVSARCDICDQWINIGLIHKPESWNVNTK